MSDTKTNLIWESFFIEESIELEEKMPSFALDSFGKSKIRLCLEYKILNWQKYESWFLKNFQFASLKVDVSEEVLNSFVGGFKKTYAKYSDYDFWGQDLLPILIWDGQLVIFGLSYHKELEQIKNHIFILTPPEVLNFFHQKIESYDENHSISKNTKESENSMDTASNASLPLEGLAVDCFPSDLDFKSIMMEPLNTKVSYQEPHVGPDIQPEDVHVLETTPKMELTDPIWDFISERHEEYYFEAKKNFKAYVVLKVNKNKTEIFKMDPDLEKQNINEKMFVCDLSLETPLRRILKNGLSESFEISQMGWRVLNYKYVCVTALKRNTDVIGFLVGFKEAHLSEADQILLLDLAKESAA